MAQSKKVNLKDIPTPSPIKVLIKNLFTGKVRSYEMKEKLQERSIINGYENWSGKIKLSIHI